MAFIILSSSDKFISYIFLPFPVWLYFIIISNKLRFSQKKSAPLFDDYSRSLIIKAGKLEKVNNELYEEEQKKSFVDKIIKQLDLELKEKFNNCEGRILDSNGNLKYTSITTEYTSLGKI